MITPQDSMAFLYALIGIHLGVFDGGRNGHLGALGGGLAGGIGGLVLGYLAWEAIDRIGAIAARLYERNQPLGVLLALAGAVFVLAISGLAWGLLGGFSWLAGLVRELRSV